MRKRSCCCIGGGVALAAIALLCAPLASAADAPQKSKELASGDGPQAVKADSIHRGDNRTPVKLDGVQFKLREQAASVDSTPTKASVTRSFAPRSAHVAAPVDKILPESKGLRTPGDNNIVLFDNMQGTTWSGDNEFGDDVIFPSESPSGQAYVIDEISLAVIRIASTSVETWAKIRVWLNYDLDIAADPDCVGVPVHYELVGTVIVNLGADNNATCDTFDRLRINLNTGEVYDLFDDVVLIPNGIISNTSPTGSIPAGNGSAQIFISVDFGQRNPAGTDVIDGPNDACDASPGGRAMYNSTGQDVLVGNSNNGWYSDTFGNNNGTWDCDEFVGFGFVPHNGAEFGLKGSLGIDCNTNGIFDDYELATDPTADDGTLCIGAGAGNGVLDECECADCNGNGTPDATDILFGTSQDCQPDYRPDECQLSGGNDCNANNIPDECDIASGFSQDCQPNGIPDLCDIDPADPDLSGTVWTNCDGDTIPDGCQRLILDCDNNGEDDFCDILYGDANDLNADGIPDKCQTAVEEVCLTFEDVGSTGFDYVLGVVHGQPDIANDGVTDSNFFFDWFTFDADLVDLPTAGLADIVSGSLCGGGTKQLRLSEVASNGLPASDWSTMSPHIGFTDPDTEVVFAGTPVYQEIKMNISFTKGSQNHDWDLYFGSIFGGPADDASTFYVNDARIFMSFNTDTTSNGYPRNIQVIGEEFKVADIDWAADLGTVHELKVVIDRSNETAVAGAENSGQVYWDGNLIATVTPLVGEDGTQVMDKVYIDQFINDPRPFPANDGKMNVDCICLKRSDVPVQCETYLLPNGEPSGDCNQDGICDVFQLNSASDENFNSVLDICEGYCDDCNHNFIPDAVEIAEGSALDVNPANGVLDVCEPATGHNVSFDDFDLGDIDGQKGWGSDGSALAEIRNADGTFATTGKFLAIKSDGEDGNAGFSLLMGPRVDSAGDADVELWTWKMRINSPTATRPDFESIYVEIADLCEDAPDRPFIVNDIAASVNTGMRLTSRDAANSFINGINLYLLGTAGDVRSYEATIAGDIAGQLVNANRAAGLRIENNSGIVTAYFAADQANIPATATSYSNASTTETQEKLTNLIAGTRYRGGDRQIMIRTDANFGADDDVEFWFDNLQYTTLADCDGDSIMDAAFIADFPEVDANGDGVLDRCQDCNGNCVFVDDGFPVGLRLQDAIFGIGCLDPCEADSTTPGCNGLGGNSDCNDNGIPDACDIDPTLPNQDLIQFKYYAGGGSCDATSNGIPDECEGDFLDCNGDGCHDKVAIAAAGGTSVLCLSGNIGPICGGTLDVDQDGLLDECETDCNANNVPDDRDVALQLAGGGSQDADSFTPDGIPDECCVDMTANPHVLKTPNGDMDVDGDVDAADYQLVQRCASEQYGLPMGQVFRSAQGGFGWDGVMCGCADFNGDGVVNLIDVQIFQTQVTGPQ